MKTKLGAFHWKAKAATIATYFFNSKYEHIFYSIWIVCMCHLSFQNVEKADEKRIANWKKIMILKFWWQPWYTREHEISMKFLFFLCLSLFGKNFHSNWVVTRDTWYISKIEKPNRKMQSLWLHIFRIFI